MDTTTRSCSVSDGVLVVCLAPALVDYRALALSRTPRLVEFSYCGQRRRQEIPQAEDQNRTVPLSTVVLLRRPFRSPSAIADNQLAQHSAKTKQRPVAWGALRRHDCIIPILSQGKTPSSPGNRRILEPRPSLWLGQREKQASQPRPRHDDALWSSRTSGWGHWEPCLP